MLIQVVSLKCLKDNSYTIQSTINLVQKAMKQIMIAFLVMLTSGVCAQIFEAEGVNMPGSYNEWTNVPTNNAFANSNQAVGGRLVRMNHGQLHWQTIFSVAAAGADISAGAYEFKFSSGPAGGYWNNTWGDGLFMMNTLTTVGYGATSNNSITSGIQ
jgi:hypothetical protein